MVADMEELETGRIRNGSFFFPYGKFVFPVASGRYGITQFEKRSTIESRVRMPLKG